MEWSIEKGDKPTYVNIEGYRYMMGDSKEAALVHSILLGVDALHSLVEEIRGK